VLNQATNWAAVAALAAQNPTADTSGDVSLPNGDGQWTNPTDAVSQPINVGTPTNTPVLAANLNRNMLLIQNNSSASVAGDTPPTLYVEFGRAAVPPYSLALSPGEGILFDVICPRSQIYVAYGPFVNTGGSVIIAGTIVQGSHSPNQALPAGLGAASFAQLPGGVIPFPQGIGNAGSAGF